MIQKLEKKGVRIDTFNVAKKENLAEVKYILENLGEKKPKTKTLPFTGNPFATYQVEASDSDDEDSLSFIYSKAVVIFDDIDDGQLTCRDLLSLLKHIRHYKASAIILCQDNNEIRKSARYQLTNLILFDGFYDKLETIHKQHVKSLSYLDFKDPI